MGSAARPTAAAGESTEAPRRTYDEIVAEVPEGFGSLDEFTKLMTRKPAWALDLRIAAQAWTGKRYCK